MGKGFDTHGPTGPYLVTTDEIPDPAALQLQTYVNDVIKQDSATNDLIFDVPTLIEYISQAMTLRPGDIIFTGTPSGVGQARDPQEWLKPGDTVRVSITGLGDLVNPVIAEP
jgi:2-keto-4-pentenoate hydratase/2-oxohepta-3-ene-1,7-dioic acid hydratase in catechol pathway